jgi:hypothetical protein
MTAPTMTRWEEVDTDEAFAALFVGRTVVFAGDVGKGDIGWRFDDGTELAMEVETGGCHLTDDSRGLPRLIVAPCARCGEERITQVAVRWDAHGGIRLDAIVTKQCGCNRESDEAKPP